MSWFCRTPSILARSLMREVALADATESASADSAAQATPRILTQRTPGILCSPRLLTTRTICDTPMTSWSDAFLASAVPTRGRGISRLNRLNKSLRIGASRRLPRGAKLPPPGRFCRAVYASLTIKQRMWRIDHPDCFDAHLRTEWHHAWNAGQPGQANELRHLRVARHELGAGDARR